MNWEAIGAVGELIGALVVVVTFIYLGRQLRLSTQQQRLESHRAMAELQIQTNRIFYDPSKLKAVLKALYDWDSADLNSQIITRQWILDTVTHYQTLFEMWNVGAVGQDFYSAEEDFLVLEILATNGGKRWWQENSFLWRKSFVERVQLRIADAPLGYFSKLYEDQVRSASDT